jgi:hypothetical protein
VWCEWKASDEFIDRIKMGESMPRASCFWPLLSWLLMEMSGMIVCYDGAFASCLREAGSKLYCDDVQEFLVTVDTSAELVAAARPT